MQPLSIGKVSKTSGVSVETIRFYEKEGLIETPERSKAGYRKYQPDVLSRLEFIRRSKDLGFSLKETKELLNIRLSRSANKCLEAQQKAKSKIVEINEKIEILSKMKMVLENLVGQKCDPKGSPDQCPILETL